MWEEKYEIGITRIDEQRKELFDRVEKFLTLLRKDRRA